ncbi:MAG: DUF294 nucleotidyltransferase-like domain-containing protein [Candidatus Nitricoxidivorans perseverans]|uniref:DUF294 nucleotidyltransferase-like domain-containing protein n=1 Tax=Candidatus Nitricoxidivorans perseverans TaxID=2975601 RepID=A0AA49FLY8_9PROT|nr:MAG: DUF294 nucleotidyltransferase-like domain-containing protein [Candidatus Nitricoxidivorans perseverans]
MEPDGTTRAIHAAESMESLIAIAGDVRRLVDGMLSEGTAAEVLTRRISTLNDHLAARVIELTETRFALPAVEWCWLAFGSEGRLEQTLSTDQDNGLLFAAGEGEAERLRAAFLPFCREVNGRLAACGFPLCKGDIMAGNPELCLSLDEWRHKFATWMHSNNPQALLNATIFFDFRPIYGAGGLAERLREWLLTTIPSATLFLRFMAGNALSVEPPLGMIRDFIFDKNEAFPHTIDLKAGGARLFVDAARILALAGGVGETGTAQRLRVLAERGKLGRDDVDAIIDGFYHIQRLRLRHQQAGAAEGAANRIDPDALNELDRTILKEAFRQAKKLQSRLQMDYRL